LLSSLRDLSVHLDTDATMTTHVSKGHCSASIDNIEQLDCAKLIGVILQENLKMDSHIHVQYILSQCAQQKYLLKLLKHQGMPIEKLNVVAHSLIVFRILYALPA